MYSFEKQLRKHFSIFVMLMFGIIPVLFWAGKPTMYFILGPWILGLVGWNIIRGFYFEHNGKPYRYTISGVKYGPKYITDLTTGEVFDAGQFQKDNNLTSIKTILLGLVMPIILLVIMAALGMLYLFAKYS